MKIMILIVAMISASSCSLSNQNNKIKETIIRHCSLQYNIVPFEKKDGVSQLIHCKDLQLRLSVDKQSKSSWGCSTGYHLCEEVYYNYKLTYKGKEIKKRIPYHLVTQAIKEIEKHYETVSSNEEEP